MLGDLSQVIGNKRLPRSGTQVNGGRLRNKPAAATCACRASEEEEEEEEIRTQHFLD